MLRPFRVILSLCVLLLLSAGALFAQSQATTGVIEGTVVDQSDAVLPGASVNVRNTATNFAQDHTTDSGGRFRALLLPLGPYTVTVTLPGFSTLVRDGVDLRLGQSVNLRLPLQISGVAQEIRVTGEAPVVETSRTAGTTMIPDEAVQGLPNADHNFLDYAKLTPGVTIVQGPDGDEMSINGQKGIHNNVSVDGQDFNNPFFGEQRGGQRPPFTFNLDAVQEVVVVADGANAEFGRSSSGFVNVITKSGTNDFHGSGHLYWKDDSLASKAATPGRRRGREVRVRPVAGGLHARRPDPAGQALLLRRHRHATGRFDETGRSHPHRAARRGLFRLRSAAPTRTGPSPARTTPSWRWQSSTGMSANSTSAPCAMPTSGPSRRPAPSTWIPGGSSANATEKDRSYSIGGSVISTLTSNLLNELRGQYSREDRPRPYDGPLIAGQNRPLPDTAFDFGRAYRFGMPFFIPVEYYDDRTQLLDNVSVVVGTHAIKFGVEWNRVVSRQTFIGFANGRFIFDSTDGFLNYARNPNYVHCSGGGSSETGACPAGETVTGPVLLYLQQAGVGGRSVEDAGTQSIAQEEYGVFLQDSWQPIRNLTINAGLRWDGIDNPDPRTPPDEVFFAPFIGQTRNGHEFPSDGEIPDDMKMWQPRLGISWDPWDDGKTVLRGTWGIFYARIPALNLASSRSTNGSIGQTIFRASFFRNFGGPPPPAYTSLIPAAEVSNPDHPEVYVFDRDFRNPKTNAFSIGVDREIFPGLAAVVKYNYAKTDQVTRFINSNDPAFGSPWSTGLGADGTNGISTLWTVESSAKSRYWGITVGLNKNLADRIGFQVFYTYSKDKSDDDNERDPFTLRYARITDLDAEYGFSDRDQRDRFNAWLLWQAPWDINVNTRYAYRSPQPISLKADGTPSSNPWQAGGPESSDRINPDGTIETRNNGRKDNKYSSLDLRVSKEFTLAFLTIEPIIEVFNLLNSDNFLVPQNTNLIFNFDGTIRSGNGDPRQVQLGLRVLW